MMVKDIQNLGIAPKKVWAKAPNPKDKLHALTNKNGKGSVDWGYHVAPTIPVKKKDGATVDMVIDPSLFDTPVTIEGAEKGTSLIFTRQR